MSTNTREILGALRFLKRAGYTEIRRVEKRIGASELCMRCGMTDRLSAFVAKRPGAYVSNLVDETGAFTNGVLYELSDSVSVS